MSLRSPLGRVRGLGSARQGTHHWWHQRVTAVLLAPLSLWFMASMLTLNLSSRTTIAQWLQSPLPAVLMLLFVAALLHHGQLGMQVVVEDYVEPEWQKIACIVIIKILALLAGLTAALSILRIFFG